MKNLLIEILWFILNKLDPLTTKSISLSDKEIKITLGKRFFRHNKWEHVSANISLWVKVDKKKIKEWDRVIYSEVAIYKRGLLVKEIKSLI